MSARVLRKVATNGSSRGKRISKISIFKANFLKQSEAALPKYLYFLDDFATFSPFLTTLFLEVNARVSDKVVTSDTFRGKQTCKNSIFEAIILNQKQRSATKKSYMFYVDIRMFMPWETTHFLYQSARLSSKAATNGSFRRKWTSKINITKLLF